MSKGRVLIVDDDADIRQVVSVLLRSEGYETETAANGQEAILKVLEIRNLDLLILDIMMPGMDGIEVCRKIRKFSNVPVLFLTAKSQDDDKVDAYNQGGEYHRALPRVLPQRGERTCATEVGEGTQAAQSQTADRQSGEPPSLLRLSAQQPT